MVEVADPEGHSMLVHQPWTMKDLEIAYGQLPDQREVGGNKFTDEVTKFCTEFHPTSHEMRRLLGRNWVPMIAKIKYNWPAVNIHARSTDLQAEENGDLNAFAATMATACRQAFPVRMDMTKIAMCKQREGETVSQYLTSLTEVHNVHSGLRPPDDKTTAEITVYEAHLRTSFINGMKDEIAKKVKGTCFTWDTGKLNLIEPHAIHAEKLLTQEKDKQKLKIEQQAHKAQLTMM
ncbi:uncharacterized protein LOC122547599 [Chiloscyllium plagiosum]|uniref:uncharacterized protein LOC122547599 n=1 Tax=Chiloscyllium plagiosum TaxID=36176 RepID=UPI001CB82B5E|nr:uncharacterized protein LOC122547599 [Chiloscyllium plagiosum]